MMNQTIRASPIRVKKPPRTPPTIGPTFREEDPVLSLLSCVVWPAPEGEIGTPIVVGGTMEVNVSIMVVIWPLANVEADGVSKVTGSGVETESDIPEVVVVLLVLTLHDEPNNVTSSEEVTGTVLVTGTCIVVVVPTGTFRNRDCGWSEITHQVS
jgi:hypothetical protein